MYNTAVVRQFRTNIRCFDVQVYQQRLMIPGFLPQDRPTQILIALMIVALILLCVNYYSRRRRRSRRRQAFYEKLRQHQEATATKDISQE